MSVIVLKFFSKPFFWFFGSCLFFSADTFPFELLCWHAVVTQLLGSMITHYVNNYFRFIFSKIMTFFIEIICNKYRSTGNEPIDDFLSRLKIFPHVYIKHFLFKHKQHIFFNFIFIVKQNKKQQSRTTTNNRITTVIKWIIFF